MVIELELQDGVCVLRVKGRFVTGADLDYVHSRADYIKSHNCGRMLVDLREVTAIGSMGIGFLVGIYTSITKNPGGRFILVEPTRRVREALELTRLTTVIPMVADFEFGLGVLRAAT
jgi:anti-anti-sigma factor